MLSPTSGDTHDPCSGSQTHTLTCALFKTDNTSFTYIAVGARRTSPNDPPPHGVGVYNVVLLT